MNTENVQQDAGEETQIYLPEDGIRNFEDKTPWNVLLNTIDSENKNDVLHLWIFQQAEINCTRPEAARENFSSSKNSLAQRKLIPK